MEASKKKAKLKTPHAHPAYGAPIYNGVGVVKRHEWFCEPGAESRAVRRCLPNRSSQTLDAADGSPEFQRDEAHRASS